MNGGEPTQALLLLVRDELRTELRNALYQAAQKKMPVISDALQVRTSDGPEQIRIHARPMAGAGEPNTGYLLVVFEPAMETELRQQIIAHTNDESAAQQLEDELTRLRAQLRASHEQYEYQAEELKAGNEELQAMNEELRSATEELETSKEELQSINEELSTVNQELKVKVEEASVVTSNLKNLINSTDIGTIFVDRSFRIVLFTPAAQSIFNLIVADYGRPLSDITSRLQADTLLEDAASVLQKLLTIEREVRSNDGRTMLVRLSPYRTEEDRIQGVVISLVDITARKQAEEALRVSEARQAYLVKLNDSLWALSDPDAIQDTAAHAIGIHLDAGRAFCLEMEPGGAHYRIHRNYLNGSGTQEGYFKTEELSLFLRQEYKAGRTVVLDDIPDDARLTESERALLAAREVSALIGVPLVKEGQLLSALVVSQQAPRSWTRDEISLVEETARRTWTTLESARAKEALHEALERLQLAASVSNFGIHDYNIITGHFYWSAELRAVLGFSPEINPGFEEVLKAIHPEDRERMEREMRGAVATDSKDEFEHEFRIIRSDNGEIRWLYNRSRTVFAGEGAERTPVRNTGIAIDITERKRMEEALRQSEELLRITTESAIDYAIISMDTERLVQSWSSGAERIFEYSEVEMLWQSADLIFTPEDRAAGAPQEEEDTARLEGMALDERWHLRKDGSRFFMSGVMRPIYNKETISGYVKVARDMTRQKEAEEALRLSEERYRISLQSAQMAAWDWDARTNTVVWNDQHYLLLGLDIDKHPKDQAFFFSFLHPEDMEVVQRELRKAMKGDGIYQAEFRIIRADNEETRWMAGYGRVVARNGKKPLRMVGVMYDITDRRRVEEQKEEFIGIASHELKTPIASVKAFVEVMQEMFDEEGDNVKAGLMRKMDGQIDRLAGLVRALLDVTRIREGGLELSKEQVDLNSILKERVEEAQLVAGQRIEIVPCADGRITADPERIGQVITNLLTNAIKYSYGTDLIRAVITHEEKGLVVQVQDYGMGMSPQTSARIFDRFFRAQEAEMSTYPGLGLGLYISAEIIRLHGGKMWVESEKGKGSTFYFLLPFESRKK